MSSFYLSRKFAHVKNAIIVNLQEQIHAKCLKIIFPKIWKIGENESPQGGGSFTQESGGKRGHEKRQKWHNGVGQQQKKWCNSLRKLLCPFFLSLCFWRKKWRKKNDKVWHDMKVGSQKMPFCKWRTFEGLLGSDYSKCVTFFDENLWPRLLKSF